MDKLKGESIPRKECYERAEGTGHSEEGAPPQDCRVLEEGICKKRPE